MSFQKPRSAPSDGSDLAMIKDGVDESGRSQATCSCGWATNHAREKVRLDRAARHAERRHSGRAIYL